MENQQDLEIINNKLYSLDVPNEPIKNIMFYFTVLSEVIDFPFPENYLNYEHPYFPSYKEMEEFLALSRSLNPDFLYHNNVIIYYNNKEYYKYYQINDDQKGLPYEFRVVDIKESTNPIFKNNYINPFNIANIDKNEVEFEIEVPNKVIFPHSEDSSENTTEEHYLNNEEEEEEYENNFQPDNSENKNSEHIDSINEINEDNLYENKAPNYQDIQKFYDEAEVQNRTHNTEREYAYENQMDSEYELDTFESEKIEYFTEKVKIKNKLIVTNEWIDYIYNSPIKDLLGNMKTVIKSDVIREKSISLPKNVFFYFDIIFLILLGCCGSTLLSWSSTLKNDHRFIAYEGRNFTDNNNHHRRPRFSLKFNFEQIKINFNDFLYNRNLLENNINNIDYFNDTVIVPEISKSHKIHKGCQLGETSGVFSLFFIVFVIYMCIRVARERKAEYKKSDKKNKAGLNMCHIIIFTLLTLLAFILTLVAEIYIAIAIAQQTYVFIHDMVRTQLILNSIMFVSYILIILFYFKI